MKEIQSQIEVHAPADQVWNTLVDFQNYREWNPFIYRIVGEPLQGAKLQISIMTPGGKDRKYSPTVTKVVAGRELRWLGKSFLLDGEHIFTLEATKPDLTRFVQREIFGGLLSRFLGEGTTRDIVAGFEQMNISLKKRVEGP